MAEPSATRARKPWLVAAGFVGAFSDEHPDGRADRLWVRAPGSRGDAAPTQVSLEMNRERTVNLLFSSRTALDGVTFTIDLPYGVEVRGHEGRNRLEWSTGLKTGNDLLPVPLSRPRGAAARSSRAFAIGKGKRSSSSTSPWVRLMAGRARRPGSAVAALLVAALLARDAASQDELDVDDACGWWTIRATVVAVLIVIDVPPPEQERAADEADAAASPAPATSPTDVETEDVAPADSPPERPRARKPGSDRE